MRFFQHIFRGFWIILAALSTLYLAGSVQADTIFPVAIVPTTNSNHLSLAMNSQGISYIAYRDVTATGNAKGLALARCNSVEYCESPTITPLDSSPYAEDLWVAVDSQDIPVVSYGLADAPYGLQLVRCDTPICSHPTKTTIEGVQGVGHFSSLVFDGSDNPIIGYTDGPNASLKIAFCTNKNCLTKTISTIGSNILRLFSMELDSNGRPILLAQTDAAHIILFRCNDVPLCTDVDNMDLGVRGFGSLRIDNNDHPVIVYLNEDSPGGANSRDVNYLRCDDALCSSSVIKTISSEDGNLQFSRRGFGLDSQDIPYISYPDVFQGISHLATCTDPTCATVEHIVDFSISNESLGTGTSLEMDGDIPAYILTNETNLELYLYNGHNNLPDLEKDNAVHVDTGKSVNIDQTKLNTTDLDNVIPQTLTYTIVEPPAQGSLNLGSSFTQTQINSGALHYNYNGTVPDQFTFTVSDGIDTIGPFIFNVNVSPPNAAPGLNYFDVPTPTLTWAGISWATNYEFELSASRTFRLSLYDQTTAADTLSITLPGALNLTDGTYYWRVRAQDNQLHWGNWSPTNSFILDLP